MTKDADKTFFEPIKERRLKTKTPKDVQLPSGTNAEKDTALFECVFPGCTQVFQFFSDLKQHLDVGKHTSNHETTKKSESLYDKIRKDLATKFTSVDVAVKKSTPFMLASESSTDVETLQMGWALSKAHAGSIRFSREVKEYLTAKFEIGERTGGKADPVQVDKDTRTATTPLNERPFSRTEWLTKTQIHIFFSRLAASKRKERGTVGFSREQEEDIECLVESAEHQKLMANIVEAIGLHTTRMISVTYIDRTDFLVLMSKSPRKYFPILTSPSDLKKGKLICWTGSEKLSRNAVNSRLQFNEFPRSVGSWEGRGNCSSVDSQCS